MTSNVVFDIYNVSSALAARRFVAKYRRHVVMVVILVIMVLFALSFMVWMVTALSEAEGTEGLTEAITPGSLALVAFVALLVRGMADVNRSVLRDRALWSVLVAPVGEDKVRAGLALRTFVFQLGMVAAILVVFAVVLLATPDPPGVPPETAPLVVMGAIVAGLLPLPLMLHAMAWRVRSHLAILLLLVAVAGGFVGALELGAPPWISLGAGTLAATVALLVTLEGPPVMAQAWTANESQRFRPSRTNRALPPAFRALAWGQDLVGLALFRREMVLNYGSRQRMSFAALNVLLGLLLVVTNVQIGRLIEGSQYEANVRFVITPFMVGIGLYAVAFFQATMPLVDGVTREGRAIWVLKSGPVSSKRLLAAKVRPLLAFLPLTAVTVGIAVPLANGSSVWAISIALLGSVTVYLAFLGVGAWAGATYPNLDRHSNAPPDVVLAVYLMFACMVLAVLLLGPVLLLAFLDPVMGLAMAAGMTVVGLIVLVMGIELGGTALDRLELSA